MGGWGSGSARHRGAVRADGMRRIDLAYMNRHGLLRLHNAGTLSWSRGGETVGWIRYRVGASGLHLSYRTREHGQTDWSDVEEDIPFAWTDTNFGGQRRWFQCPSCRGRCRVLYGGALFRCRGCYRLTYASQYEAQWERPINRAQDVRVKLGGSGSMDEPFPAKPKRMHWRTYRRLEAIDEIAEEGFAWIVGNWMDRAKRR